MAGVSPKAIYDELTKQGASTVQAIGIMANMYFESSFNPEAVGDNGTSFGLVQQHGAYSHLVTGNPTVDMQQQIRTMVSLGGLRAASGSTPSQTAGNFSANYERCTACQPGQSSYNSRVGMAATIAGWAKSGSWPASAGSGGGGGGAPQQAQTTSFDWTLGTPFEGLTWFGKLITGTTGSFSSIGDVAKSISGLVRGLSKLLEMFALLFRPEFWLRVGSFIFGLLALGAGIYFLKDSLA